MIECVVRSENSSKSCNNFLKQQLEVNVVQRFLAKSFYNVGAKSRDRMHVLICKSSANIQISASGGGPRCKTANGQRGSLRHGKESLHTSTLEAQKSSYAFRFSKRFSAVSHLVPCTDRSLRGGLLRSLSLFLLNAKLFFESRGAFNFSSHEESVEKEREEEEKE